MAVKNEVKSVILTLLLQTTEELAPVKYFHGSFAANLDLLRERRKAKRTEKRYIPSQVFLFFSHIVLKFTDLGIFKMQTSRVKGIALSCISREVTTIY